MSLRDFLLDYAGCATSAMRAPHPGPNLRFVYEDGLFICPLELASDLELEEAIPTYALEDDVAELIVTAADSVKPKDDDQWVAVRAWRSILEKLAENEVRA